AAWERHVLPQRIDRYEPSMLDMLCLTGEVSWARLTTGVALFLRANGKSWLGEIPMPELSEAATRALELLQTRGASFTRDSGERVRAIPSNRIAYRDGVAVSTMEGDCLRPLAEIEPAQAMEVAAALAGRRVPVTSGFVGRTA